LTKLTAKSLFIKISKNH